MRDERESERQREPRPVLPRRIASGRGAMEQPNATGDGPAALDSRFWVAVALTGVATGLFADALIGLLEQVQRLAFGYRSGSFLRAIERTSDTRRLAVLAVGGALAGVAWFVLRRYTRGESAEIDDAVWSGDGSLSLRRCIGTSVISEVVIGLGASIGKEAAPKVMGGAAASAISMRLRLTPAQRRLLVACGGGAGLAAAYNVPLGGALFAAEVLIGSLALPVVLPALACSGVATAVAWLYLPNRATYLGLPSFRMSTSLVVFALVVGPVVGVLSVAYVRLIGWVSHHQVKGPPLLVAPLVAFSALGLIGWRYPELYSNGQEIAHLAFVGGGGIALLFALFALKPIVTALCLGSGASGGLFTPLFSTGAALGGFLGAIWNLIWPGTPVGAFALVGAAAMIGATMQAPLAGLVLVVELTDGGFQLGVPLIAATVVATAVSRHLDGYSLYTARLAAR